jgi:UDP-N-acetylmuramoyl-tripeptide--D-alanyl-D-alanine ligase
MTFTTSSAEGADARITIAFGGDVNLGRRCHYLCAEKTAQELREATTAFALLEAADLGIVNLECVVASEGAIGLDKGERASYYYRARPEQLRWLIEAGVDFVATANNHSGDYGGAALMEQQRLLDAAGIAQAGSGATLRDALRPALRRAGSLNVAFFAFDATQASFSATLDRPGHVYLDPRQVPRWSAQLERLFEATRRQADLILVAVHWGANNKTAPDQNKIAMGHAFIDAGADVVLGSSAHVLQGIEIYQGRPIIHDAGDLFFDAFTRESDDSGVFVLELDGSGVQRLLFHPVKLGCGRAELLHGAPASAATQRFARKCAALGTQLDTTADGIGMLELAPPLRAPLTALPAAPSTQYHVDALRPLNTPRPEWQTESIPRDALLATAVRLGPLELLGVSLSPERLMTRGMLHVTSYWRLVEPTTDDWRIEFQAVPRALEGQRSVAGKLGNWGLSSDHDPCDWMWPTSRWQLGRIYRDEYTLRPSPMRHWVDAKLQLAVSARHRQERLPWVYLRRHVQFALDEKEAFAVLSGHPPRYRVTARASLPPPPQLLWSAEQLQQVTGGRWLCPPPPGWYVGSVSNKPTFLQSDGYARPRMFVATDKRMAARHELFSSLGGKHWDSHTGLPAMQANIDGAIVTHAVTGLRPDFPLLQVDDPLQALMELGVAARERLRGKVVAITGSAGKTSLSCMLAQAMAEGLRVTTNATVNYNSRCGILHLLANTPEHTDVVVMEVAVSAINAPRYQNIKLARPDIAVITNIAPSHLPTGKTLHYVAERKGNIIEGVARHGALVLYRETEYFDYLRERALARGLRVLSYGQGEDADLRLEHYEPEARRLHLRLPDGTRLDYTLGARGLHMALNSLACVAVRLLLERDVTSFLSALQHFAPAAGRGQVLDLAYKGGTLHVIDESYNANPLSVQMALTALRMDGATARRVLILGDMLELGDDAARHHRELAGLVAELEPACVLLCGPLMQQLWQVLATGGSPPAGQWYTDSATLLRDVEFWLEAGDQVLVKGSNSMGLGTVVDALARQATAS